MAELVRTELVEGVAVLSMNRPDVHNAVNDAMATEWTGALSWALNEPRARVVVLRGEGRSFCSGRDVTQLGTRAEGLTDFEFVRRAQANNEQILASPKPFIAAVKGYALGGGFERALVADIRIGTPDAVMSLPEVTYGLLPDTGGTQLLTALVGPGRAKELVLTGRRIGAEEAVQWGILNRIVPNDELDETVLAMARTIAGHSPLAVSMGKQLVDQGWLEGARRGMAAELVAQTALFAGRDYQEARAAIREKRIPEFEGR